MDADVGVGKPLMDSAACGCGNVSPCHWTSEGVEPYAQMDLVRLCELLEDTHTERAWKCQHCATGFFLHISERGYWHTLKWDYSLKVVRPEKTLGRKDRKRARKKK